MRMKLEKHSKHAYDSTGHASPSTTHKHYDRRGVRTADATGRIQPGEFKRVNSTE